jgi:septum formation inhibitor MinC
MDERKIDQLWQEITEKEKTASEDIDVEDFAAELEKNASEINEFIEKNANKEDVDKINEQGVGGKMLVESNDVSKQRLKEIAMNGLKNNQSTESYKKLRKKLLSQGDNEEMVEELSDKLASIIIDGRI